MTEQVNESVMLLVNESMHQSINKLLNKGLSTMYSILIHDIER